MGELRYLKICLQALFFCFPAVFHSLFFPCSSTFFCSFALTGRTPCTFKVIKHIASVIDDGLTVNLSNLTTDVKFIKPRNRLLRENISLFSFFLFRIPDSRQQLLRLGPVQPSHFRPSPYESVRFWTRIFCFPDSCLPHVRDSGIRKILACGIRNLEKIFLVESEILGFGIGNSAQGIRNPTNDWNPNSKFFEQRPESSTWNSDQPTAWNPESKIVLDSLTWDDRVDRPP